MFVWVDETGTDHRDHIRKFGYSLRGMTPITHRFLSRGKNECGCCTLPYWRYYYCHRNERNTTINGDVFFDFVRGSLIPVMTPFNGTNE